MTAICLGPNLLVLIGVFIVLPIVLIRVLLGRRNNASTSPAAEPTAPSDPEDRGRRREAILEKLAAKTITRAEAEQELLDLDRPLPEHMPTPPRSNKGCGTGCLIGAIIMAVLFFLLLLSLFGVTTSVASFH